MVNAEEWWESQQTLVQIWMDTYVTSSQEWLRWLPGILMGKQAHGLSIEERGLVDEIADKYSEILQKMLTLYLQNFSLNSEMSERYMELMNQCMGLKA